MVAAAESVHVRRRPTCHRRRYCVGRRGSTAALGLIVPLSPKMKLSMTEWEFPPPRFTQINPILTTLVFLLDTNPFLLAAFRNLISVWATTVLIRLRRCGQADPISFFFSHAQGAQLSWIKPALAQSVHRFFFIPHLFYVLRLSEGRCMTAGVLICMGRI